MPKFRVNVSVTQRGPLFAVAASKARAQRATTEVNEALAQEAKRRVDARLRHVLRNPTGEYQSNIAVLRGERYRGVWDSNSIKGGWLEGVSSRNRITRFKGYRTFRMVQQSMRNDATKLAEPVVAQMVRELNG